MMTVASTNAIKLPQNGPGAPQSANKGAETRGNTAPPRKRNAENDEEAILRGSWVAFSAASVNNVFVMPWRPPIVIIPTITTARLWVLSAKTVSMPVMPTSTSRMAGTNPRYCASGLGSSNEQIASALPQPKNTTPRLKEE